MTAADRNRLLVRLRTLFYEAEDHIRDLEHQIAQHETKAANVLLSGWKQVLEVWRETKASVVDAKP